MGSYPQIADKRGTHDLFGPANKLMCASYDRAMVMFLTCLKVTCHIPLDSLECNSHLWCNLEKHSFASL